MSGTTRDVYCERGVQREERGGVKEGKVCVFCGIYEGKKR